MFTIIPIFVIIAEIYGAKNFPNKQPKIIVVIGKRIISNFVFPAICFEISNPKITEKYAPIGSPTFKIACPSTKLILPAPYIPVIAEDINIKTGASNA